MATRTDSSAESVTRPMVVRERGNPFQVAWRIFRRYPVLPAIIVALLVIAAAFAPWLAQHDPLWWVSCKIKIGRPIWQEKSPISQ